MHPPTLGGENLSLLPHSCATFHRAALAGSPVRGGNPDDPRYSVTTEGRCHRKGLAGVTCWECREFPGAVLEHIRVNASLGNIFFDIPVFCHRVFCHSYVEDVFQYGGRTTIKRAPPNCTVSLISQRHSEKLPEVAGTPLPSELQGHRRLRARPAT